jgi:hypothetical protein
MKYCELKRDHRRHRNYGARALKLELQVLWGDKDGETCWNPHYITQGVQDVEKDPMTNERDSNTKRSCWKPLPSDDTSSDTSSGDWSGPKEALHEQFWMQCLEFAIDDVKTWCSMKLVSKQFRNCAQKSRALSHFVVQLDERDLHHLGSDTASGIRALNLRLNKDLDLEALAPLKALQKLRLSCSSEVQVRLDLQALTQIKPPLQELSLSCGLFTCAGKRVLASLLTLQTLNLEDCYGIMNMCLDTVLTPLVALQRLSLAGCQMITNSALLALAPLKALQRLDLSRCQGITSDGLHLLAPLQALQTLDLSRCPYITFTGLQALAPHVEFSDYSGALRRLKKAHNVRKKEERKREKESERDVGGSRKRKRENLRVQGRVLVVVL